MWGQGQYLKGLLNSSSRAAGGVGRGCFSLSPGFWDFHNGVLPQVVASWSSVRGTEAGNDLCHHLDNITPCAYVNW